MKVRVISAREEILDVSPGEQFVHMSFRPSAKDILQLADICPKLKELHLPKSYLTTLADSSRMFLGYRNVTIKESDAWGARTDFNKYVELAA